MKQFLTASALLLCFFLIALSFFCLHVSKEDSTRPLSVAVSEKNELPYLRLGISRGFARTLKEALRATGEALSSIPLFVRDTANVLLYEGKETLLLFARIAEVEAQEDGYKI